MQEWLLKAELSAGAKLTYSVLACCAGGRDYAWPSQEYLATKVSVSVHTLQRYLTEFVIFRRRLHQPTMFKAWCAYSF